MKPSETRSLLLSLLLIAAVNFSLTAQDARKEYSETFQVNKGITLSTETGYSDIELLAWERNEVEVLAVVEVEASSKSRAEEALKKIEVVIQKSGSNISLATEMESGWSRNVKVKINITVRAPAYINLEVDNSYGDLFIQEVSGLVMLDLKYSNLKAGSLSRGDVKPYSRIQMAYSNGTVEQAGWLEVNLAYTDLEILTSSMLSMESKYSKLICEKAGGIVTEGAYDKYTVEELDSFSAELKYSGIKFGTLNKSMSLNSTYTGASIEKLARGFEKVDASLSYGNINMTLEPGAAFKLETEARYGKISIAQEGKLSSAKEGTTQKIWGSVGSNPRSTINVITKYGNIELK